MILILINKTLDNKTYSDFRNFSIGGVDFGKIILADHPDITLEKSREYIDDYYINHGKEISDSLDELNAALKEKETPFKNYLRTIFGESTLNKNYTVYLSLFNCNPRFLENRTFQIFYKRDLLSKLGVCFHEVLHFQFFDYCDNQLWLETESLDKNSGPLWELSEILNVILMNEPEFREFFDQEEKLFYPGLEPKLNSAKLLWLDSGRNLNCFVKKYLLKT